jgi:hypothetical protein
MAADTFFVASMQNERPLPQVTLSNEISTLCRLQGKKSRSGACIGDFVTGSSVQRWLKAMKQT